MADVGIADGRVVEIGSEPARRRASSTPTGLLVLPGFLDLHTHYDPQVLWDPELTPSSYQGVTSVVAGNCGFSLAPCPAEMRASMLRTLDGVEDMRVDTLRAGIEWTFETHPEYLAHVAAQGTARELRWLRRPHRGAARGDGTGAATSATPTADEIAAMRAVVDRRARAAARSGSRATAPGFHRADGGHPVPSAVATQDELETLMGATRDAGRGIVHCAPGEQYHWLYDFQPRLGRPITWSAIITYPRETKARAWWGDKIAYHLEHRARGVDVHPQVTSRPVSFRISMREPSPFYMVPAFARVKAAVPDASRRRVRRRRRGGPRRAPSSTAGSSSIRAGTTSRSPRRPPSRASEGRAVAELAAERAQHPLDVVLDLAVADPEARFSVTFANDDLDGVATLLTTEGCVLGLSDAGAHVSQICDAPLPTDFLGRWVRDRDLMPVEAGVRRVTGELADLLGLADRGRLVAGCRGRRRGRRLGRARSRADPPRAATCPAAATASSPTSPRGIVHILVNGVPITADGHRTVADLDRLPGHDPRQRPTMTATKRDDQCTTWMISSRLPHHRAARPVDGRVPDDLADRGPRRRGGRRRVVVHRRPQDDVAPRHPDRRALRRAIPTSS